MYKPYALAPCGHTACHSCLVAWFKAPPPDARPQDVLPTWLRKKTCPHCRAVVKERPIGVWTVKDMVAALVKSGLAAAAFPPSPAPDAEVPTADPWEGIFRREPGASGNHRQVFPGPPPALFQQMLGLHDVEDGGIYRCIDCNHEIWDGVCSSCGRVYPGHGGGDDEDDYPEDYELEEAELAGLMFGGPYNILNHLHGDGSGDEGDSDGSLGAVNFGDGNTELNGSDDEDSEEDYESSFIDDDEHVVRDRLHSPRDHASEGSGGPLIRHRVGGGSSGNRPRPRARREVPRSSPIVISDGSDDVESISSVQDLPRLGRRARLVDSASDDETSIADAERDLSAVVAAREFDVYGDDGSVPRWRALRDIEDDEHNNY
ncbi:hypothetical protein SCP_0506160 [Sparassis crispa]|uniref:Zinc finger C3HC4 RING-type domain-containing protein n=1 Tax=Sparassis crispa TaxID=139825 RepID=A0A401GMU6_9APHY|nr:hypothetical protein SCP_0506160 [Sparassis crispa]GBE83561.1 hypothetical protein SCP_0506160 [Sparassis crispa]